MSETHEGGYHQLALFEEVTCPRCGHQFRPRLRRRSLSPVALAILAKVPERYLQGDTLPVRDIARLVGYSPSHTWRGLQELVALRRGVERQRIHERHIYRWAPDSGGDEERSEKRNKMEQI
jgi:hypothetical protein